MTDKLSDRIEAASAGSRELDAEIALAVGWTYHRGSAWGWMKPNGFFSTSGYPKFTTSLDAAMTLVPEGWRWDVSTRIDGSRGVVYLHSPDRAKWRDAGGFAATPALALCAAALRARGL